MRYLRVVALVGICLVSASYAHAQRLVVGFGVGPAYPAYVGPPPGCAYGYYDSYPYACAPYGYYGPEWFSSGVFVGAGPWYRGYYGRPGFRPDFDDHGRRYFGRGDFRGDYEHRGYERGVFRGNYEHRDNARGDFRGERGFREREFHDGRFRD